MPLVGHVLQRQVQLLYSPGILSLQEYCGDTEADPAARAGGVCKHKKGRSRQLRPIHHRRMKATKKTSVLTAFQML